MSNTSETEQVEARAKLMGVAPVLRTQDLATTDQHDDKELQKCMPKNTINTILLADSCLLFAGDLHAASVVNVRSTLDARRIEYTKRPALQQVINNIRENTQPVTEVEKSEIDRSSAQKLLDSLFDSALHCEASDIHIEIREDKKKSRVRFRIDGQLVDHDSIVKKEAEALAQVVFNTEARKGAGNFQPSRHQDAAFEATIKEQKVPIRIATIAETRGFDLVMRLRRPQKCLELKDLGLSLMTTALLRDAMRHPHGIIIFTGPTGAGKSTLVTALLQEVDALKIVSIEDPPEVLLDNVTHVTVSRHQQGADWKAALTAVNRWDSNLNVLGEVRDPLTALACKELATVGKLVITTLHTNTALSIPSRLCDLGLDNTTLAEPDLLRLLVNQRLLPVLCSKCAVEWEQMTELDEAQIHRYKKVFTKDVKKLRFTLSGGCEACSGTGRAGVELVVETIVVDDAGRDYIKNKDYKGWRVHLENHGWTNIIKPTLNQVMQGRVDPAEAERRVGFLDGTQGSFDYSALERSLCQ